MSIIPNKKTSNSENKNIIHSMSKLLKEKKALLEEEKKQRRIAELEFLYDNIEGGNTQQFVDSLLDISREYKELTGLRISEVLFEKDVLRIKERAASESNTKNK